MKNIRQVANIEIEGSTFTLVSVIVKATDHTSGLEVEGRKLINQEFTNVNDLYTAIKTNVNDVVGFSF